MSLLLIKKIWTALLGLTALCVLFMSAAFLKDLRRYFNLSESTSVEILEWIPKEIKKDRFESIVNYSFQLGDKIFEGFYDFRKPTFLNRPSCEKALVKLQERSWQVYYNPKDPSQAALQKFFPYKKMIHVLLSLAVLVYFFYFRDYLIRLLPEGEKRVSPLDSAN
ncbi:MAG: hypothetical protein WDZ28_00080 [Simkaniaceae bacterium]